MKRNYSILIPYVVLNLVIGVLIGCTPPPVAIPTLVALPPVTDTPPITPTLTPSVTPSVTLSPMPSATLPPPTELPPTEVPSPTPSLTQLPFTLTPLPPTVPRTLPTITLTASETITETITPTLTTTPTASPEIGAFGALVALAGRVTVQPIETRYSPPTQTALAVARAQIASQTPPGSVIQIEAGAGLSVATLPGGVLPPVILPGGPGAAPTGAIIGGVAGGAATPLPPVLICQFPPPFGLATLLNADPATQNALGCPVGSPPAPVTVGAASQVFERGTMIYVASSVGGVGSIYVLTADGRYRRYDDPYIAGVTPDSSGESVPPGLVEPIRGFGAVWRVNLDVRGSLGYALAGEQGDSAPVIDFARGRAVYVPQRGVTYLLIEDAPGANAGGWRALGGGF